MPSQPPSARPEEGAPAIGRVLRRWALLAVLVALAGIAGSLVAARQTAESAVQQSRELFHMSATRVAANVALEVQHQTDLLVALVAFMHEHPADSPAALHRWARDIRALQRYPQLIALADIRLSRNHAGCPHTTFVGPAWTVQLNAIGADTVCSTLRTLAPTTVGSGIKAFGSRVAGVRFIGEESPVYRRVDQLPQTLAEAKHDMVGAAAVALYPQVLLRNALTGIPGIRLELITVNHDRLYFAAGPPVQGQSVQLTLNQGLTEVISGPLQSGSIFANAAAARILAGGSALSVLLALIMFLLGTGRARAMRLVSEKTGELAFRAMHDALTGLPNRALVTDRIKQALARSARGAPPAALMFIDVDGFKTVNDTFGHGAGDELLRAVATRVKQLVREVDTVGRIGGDEFVVLLEPGAQRPAPEQVADRILGLLSEPVKLDQGIDIRLTASIGIAIGKPGGTTQELLREADLALYAAKQSGKNRFALFEESMQSAIADRHALELDLKQALANGELFLVYQPTFRLDDRRIGGVEALARWEHPTRGLIPPDVFIPIAENSGLILEIGHWVAAEACAQAAAWRAQGLELTMAINVSGTQLDEEGFVAEVREVLSRTGLDPSALTLELTETSLMRRPEAAAQRLHELKQLGVRIAIDDFGTGYSSLSYLRAFPVDTLKIDRTFISGLGESEDASAFVNTLVALGRTLKITTLGEGIEDERQLEQLRAADCELGQGFLLAHPLRAHEVEAMLRNQRLAGEASGGPMLRA